MIIQQLLEQHQVLHRGSVPGHIVINRDRENADRRLYNDYFSNNPVYNETMFCRRYRMSRSLFLRIVDPVKDHDRYFQQRSNNASRLGLSPIQKITTVFRMLAYGAPVDATNEYIKIGESTAIESLKNFCRAVIEIFSERYLRMPTTNDISRLPNIGQQRGFPRMLGNLDCMHWRWKNCPTVWAGQYAGRSGKSTIILKVYHHFGLLGTNNNINVLESSHLFSDLTQADSIYPKWSTIVQTIHEPRGRKKKYFAMKQEACRKDVERAFGVLQSRFSIIEGPTRYRRKEVLHDIMTTCIIFHNMIVEDESDLNAHIEIEMETHSLEVDMVIDENTRFQAFISRYKKIRNKDAHIELRNALIDHLWEEYTNSEN